MWKIFCWNAILIACLAHGAVSAQELLGVPPTWPDEPVSSNGQQARVGDRGFEINTQNREDARNFYNTVFMASENITAQWTGSVDSCVPGTVSQAYQDATVLRVNYFRAMAGVPAAITLDAAYNNKAQQAALMMLANNSLSHSPPTTWKCYTADGAAAAGSSNLSLGHSGPDAVLGQVRDDGSSNTAVGHRRWILYPQTQYMGAGSAQTDTWRGANALWVFDSNKLPSRPPTRDDFVSWPPKGYVPYQMVFKRWSFSYPGANFSNASLSMQSQGQAISVTQEPIANGYGENTLVWVPSLNLNGAPASDVSYSVSLQNVVIQGAPHNFNYTVIAFDPAKYGADTVLPSISGSSQPLLNQANSYAVTTVPGASSYEWQAAQLTDFTQIEGAESGLGSLVASTSSSYANIVTDIKASGNAGFHLAHTSAAPQTLTFKPSFFVNSSGAQLQFASRLGLASSNQLATVQVSTDDGQSWQTIFEQPGSNSYGETTFTTKTVSLANFVNKTLLLSFVYYYQSGSYYPQASSGSGWYIDDISFSGVSELGGVVKQSASGASFSFTPSQAARYLLQARAVVYGKYPLEWGNGKLVTAVNGGGASNPLNVRLSGGGSVVSSPAGINCGADCDENYSAGTAVTLTATPAAGYTFSAWSAGCSGNSASVTVTMDGVKSCTATFIANRTLDVIVSDGGGGTLTSNPAGINCGNDCSQSFDDGVSVTLSASPAPGYAFTGWSGSCSGTETNISVTMDANKTCAATFSQATTYLLSASKSGTGTISGNPAGIDCGSDCSEHYPAGALVTLTASPASNEIFGGWGGDCSGNQMTCSVTMSAARNVSAVFVTQDSSNLSSGVSLNGTVAENEWRYYQINAAATDINLTVELTNLSADLDLYVRRGSQPDLGVYDCSPYLSGTAEETCVHDNNGANTWYIGVYGYEAGSFSLKTILANSANYLLSINKNGTGSVVSSPAGINCGSVCSQSYPAGTVVSLTATAASGSTFSGWSGDCSGSQATCSVTLNAAHNVSATFSNGAGSALNSGEVVSGAISSGTWRNYIISASAGDTELTVDLYNLSGDVDLFVQQGTPVTDSADCVSDAYNTEAESCVLANSAATTWYISLYAYDSSNFSLKATLSGSGVTPVSAEARLVNISTRALALGGDNDILASFVIQGSGMKTVMIRGLGVNGTDTTMRVLNVISGARLGSNDNWQSGNENLSQIQALPSSLRPQTALDSGLLLSLPAGVYTAIISSTTNAGMAVAGVDDVGGDSAAKLVNISTRAQARGGDNDILGSFIIKGEDTLPVIIRGLGINGTDTTLRLVNVVTGAQLGVNDNWGSSASYADMLALPVNLRPQRESDSGMLVYLSAGVYTAIVGSKTNTGMAVVGVDALR